MIEKGKISLAQMNILIYPAILATSILSVPSITMAHAGHDMWFTPIWGALVGFLTVFIALGLNKLYPERTMIEASTAILGSVLGKIFGLFYMLYLPHLTGVIIRTYGEFIISNALPHTPMYAIMGTMVLVCAINVRSGLEVIARSGQIFVALFVILATFLLALLIGELHPAEFLPIGEKGLRPSIVGALAPAAWLTEFILIAFLLPFVHNRSKVVRKSIIAVLYVTLSMVVINVVCLLLMGDMTTSFAYPVMIAARYITIADFMQHLEAFVIAIWISGIFVKISVFLYVYSLTIAQWLGMKDYRPVVFPTAFLCTVFAYWIARGKSDISGIISASSNLYTLIALLILPSLLLAIGMMRQKISGQGKAAP
ncbi:spore germination protein [Paenibacillus oenotherae]|uniref:Spore germination protein n=1 Tax=Paenibacillus oenotherae TaxID=1435645 RepID=A0ABS7DAZ2_9BACL|nr:endospore germination permease [Paenibacillus oenotherae]MBW7477061.1 spore germination protein [Paenibacillus oenotherae]